MKPPPRLAIVRYEPKKTQSVSSPASTAPPASPLASSITVPSGRFFPMNSSPFSNLCRVLVEPSPSSSSTSLLAASNGVSPSSINPPTGLRVVPGIAYLRCRNTANLLSAVCTATLTASRSSMKIQSLITDFPSSLRTEWTSHLAKGVWPSVILDTVRSFDQSDPRY